MQEKITLLVTAGKLAYYDELKASIPPGLLEMQQIPGVGPKKVKALYEKLGIKSVVELEAACKAGKVAAAFQVTMKGTRTSRQSFLVKDGKIVWNMLKASTDTQAKDVLAAYEGLAKK